MIFYECKILYKYQGEHFLKIINRFFSDSTSWRRKNVTWNYSRWHKFIVSKWEIKYQFNEKKSQEKIKTREFKDTEIGNNSGCKIYFLKSQNK